MGHVGDHLYGLFEPGPYGVVQGKRQNYGKGKTDDKLVKTDDKGVSDDAGKHIVAKEFEKITEADPSAAPDAVNGAVTAESNLRSVHGPVFKHDKPDKRDEDDKPQLIIFPPDTLKAAGLLS
jgi:hypothetical protein